MQKKTLLMSLIIFNCYVLGNVFFISSIPICQAAGNEIYVDSNAYYLFRDGTAEHPYQTIQYAINIAEDGDTVYVFGGTYHETLTIDKKITVIGGIDDEDTMLDYYAENQYTVKILSDHVTLEGFQITDFGNYVSDVKGALIYVSANNVIIQRNRIGYSENAPGIYLDSTSSGTVIGNNNIRNTKNGIYLFSSNTNDIINNEIHICNEASIYMQSTLNNRVFGNTINASNYGIYARQCSGTNITNNTVKDNYIHGISFVKCSNDVIEENMIQNNSNSGIYLHSQNCVIRNNTITENQVGMTIDHNGCVIANNSFQNSGSTGLTCMPDTSGNVISFNYFINNYFDAKDLGTNQWDTGFFGNYWDDYQEIDEDLDGIGDTRYLISIGRQDRYPLGIFLQPPLQPDDPSPADDAEDVGLKVTLRVTAEDPDEDLMDVYFYRTYPNASEDGSDDTLVGVKRNAASGYHATAQLTLPFDTVVFWYVILDDGKLQNRSNTWFFVTKGRPPENEKPVANAGGPYEISGGYPLQFSSNGSYDPDGGISFYRWNFGDGASEILKQNPVHVYAELGSYEVTLTVIDTDGTSVTDTTSVSVITAPVINQKPTAVTGGPYSGIVGEPIVFNGNGSSDSDGTIVSYSWSFGDQTTGSGSSLSHTYEKAASYFVSLTVTDDGGDTHTQSITVTIEPAPGLFPGLPGFELIIFLIAAITLMFLYKKR